eukprot:jgi/Botrbrau1/12127/Bobra.0186s0044.1
MRRSHMNQKLNTILAHLFLSFFIGDANAARASHRELHLDQVVGNDRLGILHSLFEPVSRLPIPPPLPENPVPLGAAVFDPMTEAWYTTEFEPFEDSDIDSTPNLFNFSSSSPGNLNITDMLEDNPLRPHLPMLAKVVSALFRGQNQNQKPKQDHSRHDEPKAHGYLMKSTEHSDTMPIRRPSSNVPSEDSPSVPYFDQDVDPSPESDVNPAPSVSIKALQGLPQGATPVQAIEPGAAAGGQDHGSPLGKAAVVIGIIALVGLCAVLVHWYISKRQKPVRYDEDFDDEEILELGNYEAVSDNSMKSEAANEGTALSSYKDPCKLLVPDFTDGQALPAFRPHRKEESHEP